MSDLLGVATKWVAGFDRFKAGAGVFPVAGANFGTCVLIKPLGAPASSGVLFGLHCAAAGYRAMTATKRDNGVT